MGRLAVAVIVSAWVIPISMLVNRIVPGPYMDEIFHIPQAQEYCKGNFLSWDPMITTPPGLYLISLAHVACLSPLVYFKQGVLSFLEVCSPPVLRSVNGVLAVLCSVLVYEILCHLRPVRGRGSATVAAIVLALYPLHWFFTFLYYTDVASLTAVLAMYLACLKKRYYLSASMGLVAVFFRQTNIVWMLFVACSGVLDKTLGHQRGNVKEDASKMSDEKPSQLIPSTHLTSGSNVRRRKLNNVKNPQKFPISMSSSSRENSPGFLAEIQTVCLTSWQTKWDLIFSFTPFLIVLVAFVGFVRWNGSIVLGAKEAHTVSPHISQLLYFSLVTALMMGPLHFSFGPASDVLKSLWKNRPLSFCYLLVALTAGILSVHYFSIAHPYLLADNRHYTFYLWRKIIKAHWLMQYLLVPLYVYSWFSIVSTLRKVQSKTWVLAYFLATAAVLIPAPLVEFRYYTIPFFLLALHSPISDIKSWVLIGVSYVAINIFTMMMFLFRPFQWNHEPGIQRFIW